MTGDDIVGLLKSLGEVASAIPDPAGSIIEAALELAEEAVVLGVQDPAQRIDELRAMLRAGIEADLQSKLDQKG